VSDFLRAIRTGVKVLDEFTLDDYAAKAQDGEVEILLRCRKIVARLLKAFAEGQQNFDQAMTRAAKRVTENGE